MSDERRVVRLDPRNLRGLAHPLRIRLLGALRENGPATASKLAQQLGESSGATSYHLRQLAAHGFVEEDRERGRGRERWWRSAHEGTQLDAVAELVRNPETRGAVDLLLHELATIHAQRLATAIGEMHRLSPEWLAASNISDFRLRLTAEEAGQMAREMSELVERWRRQPGEAVPEDAEPVVVQVHSFPVSEPDS